MTPEQLHLACDILTTAAETPVGSWYRTLRYQWWDGNDEGDEPGVLWRIAVDDPEKVGTTFARILGPGSIERVMLLLQAGALVDALPDVHVLRFATMWSDPEEADFDADDADVLVQLAVFEEVVYG